MILLCMIVFDNGLEISADKYYWHHFSFACLLVYTMYLYLEFARFSLELLLFWTERHVGLILLSVLMLLITGQITDLFNLECSVPFMQDMLQTILPVLGQLLDKCEDNVAHLNEDESILLQLIVQKYSPATVALLQMDSPCWKLLLRVLSLRTAVYPGHPAPIMTALGQVRRETVIKHNSPSYKWKPWVVVIWLIGYYVTQSSEITFYVD